MTEKEYCLQRLKQNKRLPDQKIILYGTGKNAEYILDNCPEWNIIGLMDAKYSSGYFKGKAILTNGQAAVMAPDVILMAAEHSAATEIFARISTFCRQCHIELINMYGEDAMAVHQAIMEQEINYLQRSAADLNNEIDHHDGICFEFFGTLCEINPADFSVAAPQTLTMDAVKKIGRELIPRRRMVTACNYAINNDKTVMVYIGMPISETVSKVEWGRILAELGVAGADGITILCENEQPGFNFSKGLFRRAAKQYEKNHLLYVGTNRQNNLTVPLNYGQNSFMIKSCWEIFQQMTLYNMHPGNWDSNVDQTALMDFVIDTYNDPFCFYATEGMNLIRANEDLLVDQGRLEFPQAAQPLVSIIIPAHNQFKYTWYCLKSVLRSVQNIAYELILADDNSSDQTREIEKRVNNIVIIHNDGQRHFIRNCNHATTLARGKYLVFLNNDTLVYPNWLPPLVRLLEQDENIGLIGSKMLFPDGRLQEAGSLILSDGSAMNNGYGACPDRPEYNYPCRTDYISGASLMIRRELWEQIGGFDERYCPAYCEDADLAFAVRARNKEVFFQPESVVIHFGGASHGNDLTQGVKAYQVTNLQKFWHKWQDVLQGNDKK